MKRLTEWDEYGNADVVALSDTMPEIYAELSFGEMNALTDALNRLAAYEDTGLGPEEIMGLCSMHERAKMAELLRMEENKPLTLEELREMDGEPVWVTFTPDADGKCLGMWVLVSVDDEDGEVFLLNSLGGSSAYEEVWADIREFYRRKPEEVTT